MSVQQLELVSARDCGFGIHSWQKAIQHEADEIEAGGRELLDPNDIIGRVCCLYNVKVRVNEIPTVWAHAATANYADNFDPSKPLIDKELWRR
ncbi:MAG: hypothetical protein WBB39_03170 [Candidatus Saccharimonadales bacterium]